MKNVVAVAAGEPGANGLQMRFPDDLDALRVDAFANESDVCEGKGRLTHQQLAEQT
jgi:hypothetical protein